MRTEYEKALAEIKPQSLGERTRYYKGFIYGEYGVGKTVVSASCAVSKALIISTDTGVESIYNHPDLLDKIEVVPYHGLSQITAIAEAISEGHDDYKDYDLVIVDTISQVQEEYLDFLNEHYTFTGDNRVRATVRGGSSVAKSLGISDQEILGMPDYHLARNQMRHPIKALVKAPVNVIFLAHLREPSFLEQQKGKLVRRPTLTEAVFKLVARETSWMGLMERDGDKRTIQFKTDRKTVSKSRIKELDDKTIAAAELPVILKDWTGK